MDEPSLSAYGVGGFPFDLFYDITKDDDIKFGCRDRKITSEEWHEITTQQTEDLLTDIDITDDDEFVFN